MPINGYFDTVFAAGGDLNTIPDATQPGGTVSYEQGFPVLYSTPVASGGYNVPRTAINQVLHDITTAVQLYQQTGIPPFITTTMNGGTPYSYGKYAQVLYGGVAYVSLVAGNTDTPPSVNWQAISYRVRLAANTVIYVSTTGSDTNNGLTSGTPFLTIQHAVNVALQNYDLNGFTLTIQLADGTYSTNTSLSYPPIGNGQIVIQGNAATPTNVVISTASTDCFTISGAARVFLKNMRLQTSTSGNGINANGGAQVTFSGIDFFNIATNHINAYNCANIAAVGNYTISGSALAHMQAQQNGVISVISFGITISNSPNFSQFAGAFSNGSIIANSNSYSGGSATGSRYNVNLNGVIYTGAAGASYFPGNTSGTASTGGQYD